ncbi:hypothetical protein [Acinetobacter bouvetii]|uniref:Uncharacterized protein n=1 Tax=Acinetobacter bouvetii TaxID=202951 RepID=A0A811G9N0_9GAMM|nr:hypothetical protein [Acinetobacter bouvetii]CAB1214547.1 hypothetical protein SFB21_1600 [Acinetobacter bouvetii]
MGIKNKVVSFIKKTLRQILKTILGKIKRLIDDLIIIIQEVKKYFAASQFTGYNPKLAYYIRLTQIFHITLFILLFIFKRQEIMQNPLAVLFLSSFLGTLLFFSHRLYLKVSSGTEQVRKQIRYFLLLLLFCYGEGTRGMILLPVFFYLEKYLG